MKRSRQPTGLPLGRSFTSEKGEREKYESPMQDPPLDYGAYGVSVGKKRSAPPGLQWLACYLDLEPYHGPLEGTFAALKPISEYIKREPAGRPVPQQRAGAAPPAQAWNAPCPSSLSPLL